MNFLCMRLQDFLRDWAKNDIVVKQEEQELVDAVNKSTELKKIKEKCKGDYATESALIVAFSRENAFLRSTVGEKDLEITRLERRIATLEAAGHSDTLVSCYLFCSISNRMCILGFYVKFYRNIFSTWFYYMVEIKQFWDTASHNTRFKTVFPSPEF